MRAEAATAVKTHFSADCILSGARVAFDSCHAGPATLVVRNGRIEAILPGKELPAGLSKSVRVMDLKDHLILPGLINAHDHLHFGIFPRLGHGPYPSWREWAQDIHHPEEPPLRDLLDIPKETRLWWGAIHNALAGVTTICHHDAPHPLLTSEALPVNVHANYGWAHSLDDRQWVSRYKQTPADQQFIVHFAEGTDAQSHGETKRLERKVKLNERLVLVHAVGVSKLDWGKLRAAGVWIVWCPTSNLHILGHTLARDLLLSYPSIVLGSDSPISAIGDLLDELQAARTLLDIAHMQPDYGDHPCCTALAFVRSSRRDCSRWGGRPSHHARQRPAALRVAERAVSQRNRGSHVQRRDYSRIGRVSFAAGSSHDTSSVFASMPWPEMACCRPNRGIELARRATALEPLFLPAMN